MNKKEYLTVLNKHLKSISEFEKAEIIDEYETHFYSGKEDGKSEAEISEELGNPKEIAKELNASMAMNKAEKTNKLGDLTKAVIAVMGLGVLNFFVVLIPIILIISILFSLMVTTIILIASPIMLILKGIVDGFNTILSVDIYSVLASFGLGLVLFVSTFLITKWTYKIFVKYLRWNVAIVKGSVQS